MFSSYLTCVERGLALSVYFVEVIYVEDYLDFEDFYNEICLRWDNVWSVVNGVSVVEVESFSDYTFREYVVRCTFRYDVVIVLSVLFIVFGVVLIWCVCLKLL